MIRMAKMIVRVITMRTLSLLSLEAVVEAPWAAAAKVVAGMAAVVAAMAAALMEVAAVRTAGAMAGRGTAVARRKSSRQ